MSHPIGWVWPLTAAVAAVGALAESASPGAAVALGAVAVVAGAIACARALGWGAHPAGDAPLTAPEVRVGVRELFVVGRTGREELVLRLDALESTTLVLRSAKEMGRILRAPREVFLRYVATRIARIEGSQ